MADARGGSGGIEEELVGAAMQISTLRQELKRAKLDLGSAVQENEGLKTACDKSLRAIREQEAEREAMMTAHAKEVEDIKKNESDALETAQKACEELKKRDAAAAASLRSGRFRTRISDMFFPPVDFGARGVAIARGQAD